MVRKNIVTKLKIPTTASGPPSHCGSVTLRCLASREAPSKGISSNLLGAKIRKSSFQHKHLIKQKLQQYADIESDNI